MTLTEDARPPNTFCRKRMSGTKFEGYKKPILLLFLDTLQALSNKHSLQSPCSPTNSPCLLLSGIIADVSVIDTPLLFGTLMLQHNRTLETLVDAEVHAVALILHDLGWDRTPNSTIVTPDHRFEVDGAIAARKFIRGHPHGSRWEGRLEAVSKGIGLDFAGPGLGVPGDEHAAVVEAFPKSDFKNNVIEVFTWLCQTKPDTTYDTFMQPYGELFVRGYSAVGHRMIDRVLEM
ncbi:hypothetical protein N658DRAFT_569895 [Parathielavia hyrcaniae]|uniref:HD domain-containing protein n=1 Tax=Parathielavia hyrcaniae TaxID=113614 RepID=A0AAN6SXG5_9PEZI|nr:hypothetical protein N658DRAFT_569895 [Parathielavia hyrcaniae]